MVERIPAKVMEVVLLYVMAGCKVLLAGAMNVGMERASIQMFLNSTIGFVES